jgi:hypothetical protein
MHVHLALESRSYSTWIRDRRQGRNQGQRCLPIWLTVFGAGETKVHVGCRLGAGLRAVAKF